VKHYLVAREDAAAAKKAAADASSPLPEGTV
jgi:hypothetical protein